MPTTISVGNFTDQTGQTEDQARVNLEAVNPQVLIVIDPVHSNTIAAGIVISQTVENIQPEVTGGPEDSVGVRVTLTVSIGPGTWFASSVNEAEAAKHRYNPFIAVDFDFPSGHARVWSGYGQIEIDGEVFLGVATLGRVESVPERSNMTTEAKVYQLTGVPVDPALVTEEDIDGSFGRAVIEYLGFLDPETHQLVAEPEIRFEGEISNIRRRDGPEPVIEVNAEDRLAVLDRPNGWRYTHQHQQRFYEGDMGCDPAARLNRREVLWGGKRVYAGIGGSGGGRRGGGGRPDRQPN
jgi:hypothetical protein